jgi:hypothetical protein
MYYAARSELYAAVKICLATSDDYGDTWDQHANNPVKEATEAWEDLSLEPTGALLDGTTITLYYTMLATVGSTLPLGVRKIGIMEADATSPEELTSYSGNPIFGINEVSEKVSPFNQHYGATPFRWRAYYYLLVCVYGPHADNSRWELWQCKNKYFRKDERRRIGIPIVTEEFGFPNVENDVGCVLTSSSTKGSFTGIDGFRFYFGCKHDGVWTIGLAKLDDADEATRWQPSIVEMLIEHLPQQRWGKTNEEIMTQTLTESYAAAGAEGSAVEILYMIQQLLTQFKIVNGRNTVYKLNGSDIAGKFDYNSVNNPTQSSRTE